jgi:hypothetical protein
LSSPDPGLTVKVSEPVAEFEQFKRASFQGLFSEQCRADAGDLESHFLYKGFVPAMRREAVLEEFRHPQKIVFEDAIS